MAPSDSLSTADMAAPITTGMLASGQTLPQETPLTSPDGAFQLIMQSDGNVVLYNSALVATYGYSALSAVWDSATYTNSPETPYSLVMQSDCNLVAYSGLSATYGFNAATAVYESGTYTDSANLPCTLFVSSANGGSIYIEDSKQNIIFQEPARAPLYSTTPTPLDITFTTCGASGRLGPNETACAAAYASYGAWTSNPAFLSVSAGVQAWTVPTSADYEFKVTGASGGDSGGLAAVVSANIALAEGSVVYLVVGQLPETLPAADDPSGSSAAGGGGASYLFLNSLAMPLLVAGGGGGGGSGFKPNANATNTTAAPVGGAGGPGYNPFANSGVSGTNGSPGLGGNGGSAGADTQLTGLAASGGGGGGGALGTATSSYDGGVGGAVTAGIFGPTIAVPNPGAGGGFGGGGGAGASVDLYAGGGGGGYTGGAGGGITLCTTSASACEAFCTPGGSPCLLPGSPVSAEGGDSFASGLVTLPAFSLATASGPGSVNVATITRTGPTPLDSATG